MKPSKLLRSLLSAALLPIFACVSSSSGAVANVSVIDYAFVPATTNIHVNDTVIWTWPVGSDQHNVNSDSTPQAWTTSAVLDGPATFTNTFSGAGTFPYECTVHNFTGSIVVAASPPTIAITSPASGAVYAAPANVTIQASASDSAGLVTNVEFLVGSTVLGNVKSAPFSASASQLAPGNYTFSAVAFANDGLKSTNTVSISVLTPTAILLTNATMASGAFQFRYLVDLGFTYIVQRSPDLTNWISLVTNTATSNPVVFVDTRATNNTGFYRVGRTPNP